MISNNALVIPSLGNFDLLNNLSHYLNRQISDDFNVVFIIGKDVNEKIFKEQIDNVLNLSYEVISQSQRGIIDAMNKALELKFRKIILTDDDAEPSSSYIYNAIDFLENHDEAGMVFGTVNGVFPDSTRSKILRVLNSVASRESLFGRLPYRFFNKAGLMSGGFLKPHSERPVEDYMPIGVCMAWRQDLINSFKLPNYGGHGILFESYISSALWAKGVTTYFSPTLSVGHIERESLSRSRGSSKEILRELYLSPKVLYNQGFDIDFELLKRMLRITRLLPRNIGGVIENDLKDFLEEAEK